MMTITTVVQLEIIVFEAKKNPSLENGFQKGHIPNTFKTDWDEISAKGNASGSPIRDTDGWQNVSVLEQILYISSEGSQVQNQN